MNIVDGSNAGTTVSLPSAARSKETAARNEEPKEHAHSRRLSTPSLTVAARVCWFDPEVTPHAMLACLLLASDCSSL